MCVVTFDWGENDSKEKFKRFAETKGIAWAVVEVTDYCNFNCKWCFANSAFNKKPKHMPMNRFKQLVKRLASAGLRQITISGGEPTLYPHLKEAIEFAKKAGLVVHMNTNGFLLDEKLAKELYEAGLSQVQINIDSIQPQNHDGIRGRKGSFQKALRALESARKVGITCVSQTVVTRKNQDEVTDIFALARSLGLQRCRVWDMTPSEGVARENDNLLPTGYIELLERLELFCKANGATHVESGDPLFPLNRNIELPYTGGYCVASRGLYTMISVKGDVFFCATLRQPLYNIFSDRFDDLNRFHRQQLRLFLSDFENPYACQKCGYSPRCNRGCYSRIRYSKNKFDYWCRMPQFAGAEETTGGLIPATA